MNTNIVRILGARGSVPVCGADFARYGGATSSYFVRLADQVFVLDAGSGMMTLPAALQPTEHEVTVLLTHPHTDHLLGLTMCSVMFDPACKVDIYAAERGGLDTEGQLGRLMSPPLWPVTPRQLPAQVAFHTLAERQQIGAVEVRSMAGVHPGGVSLLRLEGGGHSVVLVTDCTLTDSLLPAAAEFAQNCDLLLCDGQYRPEEWSAKSAFGHNTWAMAADFGRRCGAKQTRIVHHDPGRTDQALDAAADTLGNSCAFAYAGEEVIL